MSAVRLLRLRCHRPWPLRSRTDERRVAGLPPRGAGRVCGPLVALLLLCCLLIAPAPLWSLTPASGSATLPAAVAAMGFPAAVPAAVVAEAAVVPDRAAAAAAAAADRGDLAAGARLFEAHCVGCHLGGGNIIRRGRTLKLAALQRANLASPQAIARVAAAGIGQMSGYGAVLGPGGSEQVAAWVWEQAQAGWPSPAQPRRRDNAP